MPIIAQLPTTLLGLLVWIIIIAAVVAIVVVACRAMNITIPQWLINIGGIVAIAVVALVAIGIIFKVAPWIGP
jgi:hypothetical protein